MKKQTFKQFLLENVRPLKYPLAIFRNFAMYITDLPLTISRDQFITLCELSCTEEVFQFIHIEWAPGEYVLDIKTELPNIPLMVYLAEYASSGTWKEFVKKTALVNGDDELNELE